MYAIFQSGGKQHLAIEGQTIRLEKINVEIGKIIQFYRVLMISNKNKIIIGTPLISGASIKAEIIDHSRRDKIKIIKFRRRKHYCKQQGHRQWFTTVKIININI